MPSDTASDPRWPQIVARDPGADGHFWYSVITTGVYCRPSCPSRTARPENVRLHDSPEAARATGARACRRCDPDAAGPAHKHRNLIAAACRLIDSSPHPLTLAHLARHFSLSPGHFQRIFKAATGLSPRTYGQARKAARLRDALRTSPTVTEAIHAAGYGSSSRFYEKSAAIVGMAPATARSGAAGETIRFAVGPCTLGLVLVALSRSGVVAILLGDDAPALIADLCGHFPRATVRPAEQGDAAHIADIVHFIDAPSASAAALPLDIRGTVFQHRVWQALRQIPPGTTSTYTDIAHAIGAPDAARAVARACAGNRLAVAIPCHRVIRRDGTLSGYRWGVARKRTLLEREGR